MVILSLYVTKDYISGVLLDLAKEDLLDKFFINIPYNADFHDSILTTKKLDELLIHIEKKLSKLGKKQIDRVIVTSENIANIVPNYTLEDIIDSSGLNVALLDYYNEDLIFDNQNDTNNFHTLRSYKQGLDLGLRSKADYLILLNKLKYTINDRRNFIISTLPLSESSIDKYLSYLFENISKSTTNAFLSDIYIDFNFAMVPVMASIKRGNLNSEVVNKWNLLKKTTLLALKNVDMSRIFINDKEVLNQRGKLMPIKLKPDEKLSLDIKYAGGKFRQVYEKNDLGYYLYFE